MKFSDVTHAIIQLCNDPALSFQERAQAIAHSLDGCLQTDLLDHLDHSGIIPEQFEHDSTEEKLFAKYCDALLARSWSELGLKATVIVERADTADVIAKGRNYSVVGDAKAFRLSRTAKNQKDFKVEALNNWRKGADYAALIAPLYQYPGKNSQIYEQAIRYNVTLLSYTHLAYLIRHNAARARKLGTLWGVAKSLDPSKSAAAYWLGINDALCRICGSKTEQWQQAVAAANARLPSLAAEQIGFLEGKKKQIHGLSREEAISLLVDSLNIDARIAVIRKNIKPAAKETSET